MALDAGGTRVTGAPAGGRLRRRTDRRRNRLGPLIPAWAVGSFVPIFNVPIATGYLLRRREELRQPGQGWSTWVAAILGVGLASVGLVPLLMVAASSTAAPLYVFVTVLLPMAIYFDFESREPDRTLAQGIWTAGTAVLSLFSSASSPPGRTCTHGFGEQAGGCREVAASENWNDDR